jgi:hypothetical protein
MAVSKLKGKAPETVEPGKTKGVIFGPSGSGKTWFTLSFPTPFYIDTEGGANLRHYQERLKAAGGSYLGPEEGALDFATIIDQMQVLATEKHPYKTLIIDSITKVYQTAIANESERLGVKDVFGASKKPAINWMRRLVNWSSKLDMNIWFVAHEATEWGEVNGQRAEIGKTPDVWDKLIYELDIGIKVLRRGNVFPATGVVHKSRLLGFPQGDSFQLDYNSFAERYGKNFIEKETKQITLAASEQVAEIIRLVTLLNVSPEDCEKVLTKAGADKWEELSDKQAVDMISRLTSKITGGK